MSTQARVGTRASLSHFVYPDSAPLWAWIFGHLMFGLGMWLVAWPRLFRARA